MDVRPGGGHRAGAAALRQRRVPDPRNRGQRHHQPAGQLRTFVQATLRGVGEEPVFDQADHSAGLAHETAFLLLPRPLGHDRRHQRRRSAPVRQRADGALGPRGVLRAAPERLRPGVRNRQHLGLPLPRRRVLSRPEVPVRPPRRHLQQLHAGHRLQDELRDARRGDRQHPDPLHAPDDTTPPERHRDEQDRAQVRSGRRRMGQRGLERGELVA
mmetsp:Transcript_6593/g.26890  ORF Transcript_6593/g.26890 Transcript_6593/m.26890 type:complete len:214 (+) Transcript_6593:796-1437(+)